MSRGESARFGSRAFGSPRTPESPGSGVLAYPRGGAVAWERSTRAARLPGDWAARRRFVLERDPVCRVCRRAASVEVDHVIPGDDHNPGNLQGICTDCHKTKTQTEAFAGRTLRRRPDERHPGMMLDGQC